MARTITLTLVSIFFMAGNCHTALGTRPTNFACRPSSDFHFRTTCGEGVWPGSSDAQLNLPQYLDNYGRPRTSLEIASVTVRVTDFQALPSAEFTEIALTDITVLDGNHNNVPLPVREFLSGLTRYAVKAFVVNSVKIGAIDQNTFEGFTGIEALYLRDGGVTQIHPDSFQHFTLGPRGPVLSEFNIEYETELRSFPWESLRFFNTSLKRVNFARLEKLSNITFSASAGEIVFYGLEDVIVADSPVTTISAELLATIMPRAPTAIKKPPTVTFFNNANFCTGNALGPLIAWVKATQSTTRYLFSTCNLAVYPGGSHVERSQFYGTSRDWTACTDKPVCNAGH